MLSCECRIATWASASPSQTPVTLTLRTNPSQTILPGIIQNVTEILLDAGFYALATLQPFVEAFLEERHHLGFDSRSMGYALRSFAAYVDDLQITGPLRIEAMASRTRILAVTEGPAGARLYWHSDQRRFQAPTMEEIDATGAGDIFAAAYFIRLLATRDPWEAARFWKAFQSRSRS